MWPIGPSAVLPQHPRALGGSGRHQHEGSEHSDEHRDSARATFTPWSSLPCVPRHSLLLLTRDLPSSPWLPDHKSRQRVEYLRRRLLGPAFILIYLRLNVTVTTDAAGNAHPTSGVSAHPPIRPA